MWKIIKRYYIYSYLLLLGLFFTDILVDLIFKKEKIYINKLMQILWIYLSAGFVIGLIYHLFHKYFSFKITNQIVKNKKFSDLTNYGFKKYKDGYIGKYKDYYIFVYPRSGQVNISTPVVANLDNQLRRNKMNKKYIPEIRNGALFYNTNIAIIFSFPDNNKIIEEIDKLIYALIESNIHPLKVKI